jgi:hypothetical protein
MLFSGAEPKIRDYLCRGWELMAMCCLAFPPTQDLENWFRKYLLEHTKAEAEKEAAYARYCVKKLDLMCDIGCPSRGRVPSRHELDRIRVCPSVLEFG